MKTLSRLILFLLLFVLVNDTFSKGTFTPDRANPFTEPWRWQHYSNLGGKSCRCMAEDSSGVLWFGVTGGLMSYNGIDWDFHPLNGDSSQVPVISLCATSMGLLYVGTPEGISLFAEGEWTPLNIGLEFGDSFDFPNNKFPILEAPDKSVWIGTQQGALRIKNDVMTLYREFHIFPDYHKPEIDFTEQYELEKFDVFSIYIESDSVLWMGLRDGRIYKCILEPDDLQSMPTWVRIDQQDGYILSRFPLVMKNVDGLIFVVSGEIGKGINVFDGEKWYQESMKEKFQVDDIHADIVESRDGSLWIGSFGKIFEYSEGKWYMYVGPGLPLPSNRWNLFKTKDGSLWIIGLGNQVWRVDLLTERWTTFQGIHFQAIDKDGCKWFLSYDGQVIKTDPLMKNWTSYDKSDGVLDEPVVLYITSKGQVWIAGSHNEVAATAYLDNEKWHIQTHPRLAWCIGHRAVLEDAQGNLWFGSGKDFLEDKGQIGGLIKYSFGRSLTEFDCEYFYFNDRFHLSAIYGIGQSGDGKLWCGQLGFFCFDPAINEWTKITEPIGLDESFNDCISTSEQGNLWVGTRTCGVFSYNYITQSWSQYTINDGLSSNTIISMYALSDSNVWVATDQNICHFDGRSWTLDIFPHFIKINKDGITLRALKDGTLWFNNIPQQWLVRAINKETSPLKSAREFFSIQYKPDKLPPETFITFSQDKISQPGNVILSWMGHDPWKATPDENLLYSYKLDNEDWTPFSDRINQVFLNLKDGNHTFLVKSRDRDMNVDPSPDKVQFYIIPYVWKQPWFIGLIAFFFITIAFFMFHLVHRNKIIKELSEAKVRLFTNISHELRTPLTLILGPLNNLRKKNNGNSDTTFQLEMMNRNCNRLMRLVNQVLDFQKVESGQIEFDLVKGDVVVFISDVTNAFQSLAGEKQLVLEFKTQLEHLEIFFDFDKLEKVLLNLLSNSLKFTHSRGSVQVIVSQIPGDKEMRKVLPNHGTIKYKDKLQIIVKDTGIGIPREKLNKIFKRFYQVQEGTDHHAGGTGIGLALTKELVEIQQGKLSVESEKGVGTAFTVEIPAIYSIDNAKDKNVKVIVPEVYRSGLLISLDNDTNSMVENPDVKILLVEDNSDMRNFIRNELETQYTVTEAIDGFDGLEKTIKQLPDIIITDIMMPRMGGIEFCKKIKTDPRTSHIPVIMITARSSHQHVIEGLETGADDYLAKPFDSKELSLRIHNILETRKQLWNRFQQDIRVEPKEININSVDQQFLAKAIDIVEQHMDDPDFDSNAFSLKMGTSRAGLYNKIRVLTGHSVRDFINAIRLKRSAQLLKESGMTITEITYEVGFRDPSYFSKAFKKYFGKLPTEYVKEFQK